MGYLCFVEYIWICSLKSLSVCGFSWEPLVCLRLVTGFRGITLDFRRFLWVIRSFVVLQGFCGHFKAVLESSRIFVVSVFFL